MSVSVVRCASYSDAYSSVSELVKNLGGIEKFVKAGQRVLIKPNLLMPKRPDEATTTHPAIVSAVARIVKEAGATAVIADSSGGPYNAAIMGTVYRVCGMTSAAAESGAELYTAYKSSLRDYPEGLVCKQFPIIDAFAEADVVINLCKFKTHSFTGFSGAVKNMFGLVPGLIKPEFHFRFPDKKTFCGMLVDLCEFSKPSLSIMDAVAGMEGNGPSGGDRVEIGLLFASESPYELDLAAISAAGFGTDEIFTLSESIKRGHIPKEAESLNFIGMEYKDIKIKKIKRADAHEKVFPKMFNFLEKPLAPKPVIIKNGCIGCAKCAESCPPAAIKIESGKAAINYKKCIKCFCCQEMCPVKTIEVKRFSVFKI